MAYGLRIWNNTGGLVFEETGRSGRFVLVGETGFVSVGGYVDISVPGLVNNDSWAVLVVGLNSANSSGYDVRPTYTISNNSIRLTNSGASTAIKFTYWVYRI